MHDLVKANKRWTEENAEKVRGKYVNTVSAVDCFIEA